MLQEVDLAPHPIERYVPVLGLDEIDRLRALAAPLKGLRVAHINATRYGGGVSELLHSLVPFMKALGIEAHWKIIPGDDAFFHVTKGFHNALQGADFELTEEVRDIYLKQNRRSAELLDEDYDLVMVHDPQPAALRSLHGKDNAKWIWRCHIDTSQPNAEVLAFLKPFILEYESLVFTMPEFVPKDLADHPHAIIPPSIDPLSPKNMTLTSDIAHQIVEWTGVRLDRLLMTQVSRFDPWKDPLGVIRVYRAVKEEVPGVQLALLGQMALDDPEGWDMYKKIAEEAQDDEDLHIYTNFTGIGNLEVNAFQASSNVVLQKSVREGFGLVVSETLWKGTPVVAGRAGGIPMQMPKGVGGVLIDDDEACAKATLDLLKDPAHAHELAAKGRAHVRERFLTNREIADHLNLFASVVNG